MKRLLALVAILAVGALAMSSVPGHPALAATKTAAPTVVTVAPAAASITSTSATYQSKVTPNGLATTAWFQWTPPDGDTPTTKALGSGTLAVAYSVTVTGLKPSTTYKVTAYASNSRGTGHGSTLTFKTLAASPTPAPTPDGIIYLTFDDGPTAGYTNAVLTDLAAAGAHATFFMIGQSSYTASGMQNNQALTGQVLASGNQVATHSWDHPNFSSLTRVPTATEISQARTLQVSLTGRDSRLFRFPYNVTTAYGTAYLASQEMQSVGADIDPSDWNWRQVSDAQVIATVMAQAKPGAVVQFHDGQDVLGRDGGNPGYLPGLLAQLKAAGYSFGTLNLGGAYPNVATGSVRVGTP
jgi:peptidoglycan/xylan/chitin deacetylase (PgdA/CDA1 family)